MKKFFMGLMLLATMSTTVTFTSCDDDDVNTIIGLLDMILGGDDLSNTSWLSSNPAYELDFQGASQGYISYLDENNEVQSIAFNYSIDSENNLLILTFSDATWQFTVVEFEANNKLVLNDSEGYLTTKGANITFSFVTPEEGEE